MTYVKAPAAKVQQQTLSPDQRSEWNSYIDYLKAKGLSGNPALDNRDTGLSQKVFNDYKAQNPHFTLTYDQVPVVQADLQSYRNDLVNKWKKDPTIIPGVKSEDEIMGGISPVDGWLGSKTSSHKYPVAQLNQTAYGTNLPAYDAAMAKIKNGN